MLQKKKKAMNLLIFRASKISFFLMLFLSLPVMVNARFILKIWLKVVPDYAPSFVCLALAYCLLDSLSMPINSLVNATGKIKSYQVIIGTVYILNIPLAYWLLSLGISPEWVLAVRVFTTFLLQPVRLLIAKRVDNFPIHSYCRLVCLKVAGVFLFSAPVSFVIAEYLSGWSGFFVSSVYSSISIAASCWFFGLNNREQEELIVIFQQKLWLFKKKFSNKMIKTVK